MKALLLTASLALFTMSTALAGKAGWEEDYAKSLEKAKTENKLVLLDFTGSDWCGWCIKLDEEVFSKQDFKKFAKDTLVLVELDYPQGKRQSKKVKDQNDELKTKYKVQGYPTIVLVDKDGKEVHRWGGYSEKFLEELKTKVPAAAEKKS